MTHQQIRIPTHKYETHFSIYSLPAFLNNWAALGASVKPLVAFVISVVILPGCLLFGQKLFRLPGIVFSNPTTRIQSAPPWPIVLCAMYKPVEPVEQLLLTLNIGIWVFQIGRILVGRRLNLRSSNMRLEVIISERMLGEISESRIEIQSHGNTNFLDQHRHNWSEHPA